MRFAYLIFFLFFNVSALQADLQSKQSPSQPSSNHSSSSGMVKVGLTDIPEKENFSLEYFIKEKAYLKLLERDILPHLKQTGKKAPTCFISYAWGDRYHEYWVKRFAEMLDKAGIQVLLDSWEIKKGNILSEFVKKIEKADWVIVVGTKLYLEKYNRRAASSTEKEHVARLEEQLIEYLVRYSTERGNKVVSILLEGSPEKSLPFMLRHKILSDFTQNDYFEELLELIHDLYNVDNRDEYFEGIIEKFRKCAIAVGVNVTEEESKAYEKRRATEILALDKEISKEIDLYKKEAFKITASSSLDTSLENEVTSIQSELMIPAEPFFLERPKLITAIDDKFKEQQGIQTIALVGIGGAGKTTLARQYARLQRNPVVWEINAETHETLVGSFEKLAYALSKTEEEKKILRGIQDIKNSTEREEKIIQLVKEYLRSQSNWLLIYDNVEKFVDIQKYFPQDPLIWGKGKIILTTRVSHIQYNNQVDYTIQIGELNTEEKLNLFIKIMNHEDKFPLFPEHIEETKKFLEEMPPFPLDVSVAAYYVKATNISYEDYLNRLNEQNEDFVSLQEALLSESSTYTKTRFNIIALSLRKLIDENKNFHNLLLLVSLLDSQNIPRDLLETCQSVEIVDNFIYSLKKYSFVTGETTSVSHSIPTISFHRSTQKISLVYLKKMLNPAKAHQISQLIADTLENFLDNVINREDVSRMKLLVSHCEMFLNHDNLITEEISSYIEGKLGFIYNYLGHREKAKQILEESLIKLNKNYNKNYIRIPWVLTCLGNVYREFGDYEKAKESLKKSIVIYKSYCKTHDIRITYALIYLGDVYRSLGNYEIAKNLYEESLEIYKKVYGIDHIKIAWPLACLANIYAHLGVYKNAKELMEKSYEIYKKNFSEDHIGFAWASVYLGSLYNILGKYKESEEILYESWTIYNKHYGENHIRTAWCVLYLGQAYEGLGKYTIAKSILEHSYEIFKKYYGEDNYRTATLLLCLGDVYRQLGHYKNAKKLFEQSLVIYEKHYGKIHIEYGRVLINLGVIYLLEDNMETAGKFFNNALAIYQQNNYSEIYIVLESLAELCMKKSISAIKSGSKQQSQEHKKQALEYIKQASETLKTHFPPNSPHLIRVESKLRHLIEH